jgi:SAM-dependent methyltransferase
MKLARKFSHVPYASDYMMIATKEIEKHFGSTLAGKTVLDLPAGNGWIGDDLSAKGCKVTSADINEERSDFVQADMEKKLPFHDLSFDAVICCEGIEHVFTPFNLFSELHRVLKPGGILIITTPNIQNLYSRIQFLCTGYLFQFDPFDKLPIADNIKADKGHISPVSLIQLIYWSEHFGLDIKKPLGSRLKKRWLLPFFIPALILGRAWVHSDWRKTSNCKKRTFIKQYLYSIPTLLSRSIIFSASKPS